MEDFLEFSEEEYPLVDFVSKFILPQVVRVEQGYHDGDEDTALGNGQVVTIHATNEADSVIAKDQNNRKVYIPKSCSEKVEIIVPGVRKNYFGTVAELSRAFPRATRILQEASDSSLKLNYGEKLTLKKITKKKTILECENEKGSRVRLPMNLQGRFVPLEDGQEYSINEVINSFKLPVLVQFVDSKKGKQGKLSPVFKPSLGILSLEDVTREETVVCSTQVELTDKRYVITIPRNFKITVAAAKGAIADDHNYMCLRKTLNDNIELSKIEALESENVYASRQQIRQYMELQFFSRNQNVYASPEPPRPLPRLAKSSELPSHGNRVNKITDEDDSLYESIVSSDGKKQQSALSTINTNANQEKFAKSKLAMQKKINTINAETDEIETKTPSPPPIPISPKPTQENIDFSSLSVDSVANLLSKHRLGVFVETFQNEEIDGNMLLELDLASLKDLGLNNFQAKKLMLLIHGWLPKVDK